MNTYLLWILLLSTNNGLMAADKVPVEVFTECINDQVAVWEPPSNTMLEISPRDGRITLYLKSWCTGA